MSLSILLRALIVCLPWCLRRILLENIYGYRIHRTAKIGFSWVFPDKLEMEEHSRIGHLTVCKGLSRLKLGASACLGNLNWITGFPRHLRTFFADNVSRAPELSLGAHAAITHRHLIDCTDRVAIGDFTTVAGFHTQILTHSVNLQANKQTAAPVSISSYCFVGTRCTILPGSLLPDHCVLAAGSVLEREQIDSYSLYGGVPARAIKSLPEDWQYFSRSVGFVS